MSLIEPAHNSPTGNPNAYIGRPLAKERWKKMHRLGNRPPNRTVFLGISLLMHGAAVLGIYLYWRKIGEQPIQTQAEALTPIKFVEVPADRLGVKPPLNAKLRAANNSRAGGKARPDLPIETGALSRTPAVLSPSSRPSSTKSKLSTSQPRQANTPPQAPQPAQRPEPLSRTTTNLSSSPPVAQKVPKTQPSPQPRQEADTLPQSSPVAQDVPKIPRPSQADTPPQPLPVVQNVPPQSTSHLHQADASPQQRQPALRPQLSETVNNLNTSSTVAQNVTNNPNVSPSVTQAVPKPKLTPQPHKQVLAPQQQPVADSNSSLRTSYIPNISSTATRTVSKAQPTPQLLRPAPQRHPLSVTSGKPKSSLTAARAVPERKSSFSQPLRQNANPLGGPVTLASHSINDYSRDELVNSNRQTSDAQGVDAQKDVEMGPYLLRVTQKVERLWPQQTSNTSRVTKVSFLIHSDGEITNLHVVKSSGSTSMDQEALEAVKLAAPFEPLPKNISIQPINYYFKFHT